MKAGALGVLFACATLVIAEDETRCRAAADQKVQPPQRKDWVTSATTASTAAPLPARSSPYSSDVQGVDATAVAAEPIDGGGRVLLSAESLPFKWSADGTLIRVDVSAMEDSLRGSEHSVFSTSDSSRSSGRGCGDPEAGSCCEANETPYCDDVECCLTVCYEIGYEWCCDEELWGWDEECADMAREVCDCPPPVSACCTDDACMDLEYEQCVFEGGRWFRGWSCDDLEFECHACPPEASLYSQNVDSYFPDFYAAASDLGFGPTLRADRFWDVAGDILGVKWYGHFIDYDSGFPCTENPMIFDIVLYEDAGGFPGTEVCSYTVTPMATIHSIWSAGEPIYEFVAELDTCCTLESGWLSIQAHAGAAPICLFAWTGSEQGDGTSCRWDLEIEDWICLEPGENWAFDVNFCLLGTPYPGACCDEIGGTCEVVEAADCPATSRFAPGVACDDLEPPCGTLAGACCIDEPPYCYIEAGANCEGYYLGDGTECDPNDCNENGVPDTCDIASGYSDDCDLNDVPDECDIAGGADDYDGNRVLDACEPDCNDNGVVDACDISCAPGTCDEHPNGCGNSDDCQPNGVPDDCELGTLGGPVLWDNGAPNDTWRLRSHYGGQAFEDALTVDDISLPEGGVIHDLHWYVEDDDAFDWQGRVRVEIFADNGEGGPDDATQVLAMWVPTDGGTVIRTLLGAGTQYPHRYRFDVYDLDIPLGAGIWWIGMAPDGGPVHFNPEGASRWCASQSGGDVIGAEAHFRAPSLGYRFFEPWSDLGAPGPYDAGFTVTTTVFGADCDGNDKPDDCDIADCDNSTWCQDCQGDGIPDGCEPDCNGNEIADQCDIIFCDGSAWCGDCNCNEIPDECDLASGTSPDCNGNDVPDECDVASGSSPDCNGNGVPDECDIDGGTSDDYDLNGVPDECDPDCNDNGVPDPCDVDCAIGNCISHPLGCEGSPDCQPDGIPDDCQLGTPSTYLTDDGTQENSYGLAQGGTLGWMNLFVVEGDYGTITAISLAWGAVPNGSPCTVYLWSDPNGDGSPADAQVLASAETVVVNADTNILTTVDIPDTYVGPAGTVFFAGALMDHQVDEYPAAMDYDGWGLGWITGDTSFSLDPNDLDGGSAGLEPFAPSWLIRAEGLATNDCNQNSVPDECDIASGFSEDCDSNGVPDECEWLDCNSNGVFDVCDILDCDDAPWCSDCNGNGIPDQCDVPPLGAGEDCQPNGIPDECEEDCNANGMPDDCDLRDCDGSIWCDDCNGNGMLDECDAGHPSGLVYQHDNGSAENALGLGQMAEIAWIQRFDAEVGSETIVAVATSFGNTGTSPGYSGVQPGDSFRVFIWEDPMGEGAPSGAVLRASATAYVDAGSIDTDVLQEIPIGPVTVSGSFFVGAAVVSAMNPAPMDEDGELAHESWIAAGWLDEGGFDPTSFWADNTDEIEFPCNWLLRAITESGPAPNDCNVNGIPDDCELCGDLDSDGDVDYDDYVIFLDAFGGETDGEPAVDWCCDYDDTGAVGMADYAAWLDCYRAFEGDPLAGPPARPLDSGPRRLEFDLGAERALQSGAGSTAPADPSEGVTTTESQPWSGSPSRR